MLPQVEHFKMLKVIFKTAATEFYTNLFFFYLPYTECILENIYIFESNFPPYKILLSLA